MLIEIKICEYCKQEFEWDGAKSHKNDTHKRKYSAERFCSRECGIRNWQEKIKQTNLKRYGVENCFQSEDKKERIKQTNLERYGVENAMMLEKTVIKAKKTKLELYGDENYKNMDQIKRTKFARYGKESFTNREKCKQTNLERYGTEYVFQRNEIKEKIRKITLEKYGKEFFTQTDIYKIKTRATKLKNHGTINNSQTTKWKNEIKKNRKLIDQKSYITKKKNNSFHISKVEEKVFELLLQKYSQTIHHYKSTEYPWNCDFYIPELNLWLECNFHWTHGKIPYNPNICKKQLDLWIKKSKESDFYKSAIETWTVRDVKKRQWAIQNNLNWLEFFTLDEFSNWFNQ